MAAGTAAEMGAGAATIGAGEAAMSKQQTGQVDMGQVGMGAGMGGLIGGVMGVAQSAFKATKRASQIAANQTNVAAPTIQAEIHAMAATSQISLPDAARRVLAKYGVNSSTVEKELELLKNELNFLYAEGGLLEKSALKNVRDSTESFKAGADSYTHPVVTPHRRPSEALWETAAYNPSREVKAIVTKAEFAETSAALSKNGKKLSGAALDARYKAFHKDLITHSKVAAMGDAEKVGKELDDIRITQRELEDIMMENDPALRAFFLKAGRKKGGKETKVVKQVREGEPRSAEGPTPKEKYKAKKARNRATAEKEAKADAKKKAEAKGDEPVADGPSSSISEPLVKEVAESKKLGNKQRGFSDPKSLTALSAATIAGLAAYANTDDPESAVTWAIMASGGVLAGSMVLARAMKGGSFLSKIAQKKKFDFDRLLTLHQGDAAVYERRLLQLQRSIWKVTGGKYKGKKLREEITKAIESGKAKGLPKEVQPLVAEIQDHLAKGWKELHDQQLVSRFVEHYVPHFWEKGFRSESELLDDFFGDKSARAAFHSIHERKRFIPTYQAGIDKGLTPKTMDIGEILPMYLKAIDNAKRNNVVFHAMKREIMPGTGFPVIMGSRKAPASYVPINHPRFNGMLAHPEAAPFIKMMFGSKSTGPIFNGVMGLNFLMKRMAVSLSGFHAKALIMSNAMAGGLEKGLKHPIKSTKDFYNMLQGKSPALNLLYSKADTGASRQLDLLLREGLIINSVDDVGSDTFYSSLTTITNALDNGIEKVGNVVGSPLLAVKGVVKGVERLNRLTDGMMWDRIYTGMKIQTAMDKATSLAAKHNISEREAARYAAEFTNDAFGGLNWAQLANNVTGRYASQMAMAMAGKKGRQNMQIAMFAPDWTVANVRVAGKAFANKNPIQRSLYQGYLTRGMIMFVIGADALNYTITGHHIWENEDPTTVELGDGRRMTISKQLMEPAHWVTDPQKSALNKMSSMIRTGGELMTGREWMAGPKAGSPPIDSYMGHLGKKFTPIWLQQGIERGAGEGAWSGAGFPIKGQRKPGLKDVRGGPKRKF